MTWEKTVYYSQKSSVIGNYSCMKLGGFDVGTRLRPMGLGYWSQGIKPRIETHSNPPDKDFLKHCFFNQCFDKGRLKNFVLWFLKNYGQNKTVKLVEQLKNIGFEYASKAGISLGIDDLKIPYRKSDLIFDAEKITTNTIHQYARGEITGVERFQRLIDTWHRTSESLKQEVIDYFEATDILNPVYMMAFSGARGNISQVRQLVGMRGLMADPQGQIIDFPIRSNFREGLTLTEYLISSYGARKGIVDTALRTANAGYLTRRLVDVAQHVIISHFDCGTHRGIFLKDMKEGNKTIHSLIQRVVGRILARDLIDTSLISKDQNKILAKRNEEITMDLALSLVQKFDKIFVRSPLTCETNQLICQLCYGWSLGQGSTLVSIGEAVGVVAAQSIGEPGTQLTMRTFHTGGVFSGDISDQIRAPFYAMVEYPTAIPGTLIRTPEGKIAFLTKGEGSFFVKKIEEHSSDMPAKDKDIDPNTVSLSSTRKFKIPSYTLLYIRNKQSVNEKEVIAQISTISRKSNATDVAELTIQSEYEGQFYSKSLGFREKFVGDAKLIESGLAQIRNQKNQSLPISDISQRGPKDTSFLNNSTFYLDKTPDYGFSLKNRNSLNINYIDKLYESWTWGYAWVLSGKIYELNLRGETCFPKLGDLVNTNSSMNQTQWNVNFNNGPAKMYYTWPEPQFGSKNSSYRLTKLLSPTSYQNILNKDISGIGIDASNVSIAQPFFFFDILKIRFQKYGYILTSRKKSSSFEYNLFGANSLGNDLLFRMYEIYPNISPNLVKQNNSTFYQDKTSDYGFSLKNRNSKAPQKKQTVKGNRTLLHWFPYQAQTTTGGFMIFEKLFKEENKNSLNKNIIHLQRKEKLSNKFRAAERENYKEVKTSNFLFTPKNLAEFSKLLGKNQGFFPQEKTTKLFSPPKINSKNIENLPRKFSTSARSEAESIRNFSSQFKFYKKDSPLPLLRSGCTQSPQQTKLQPRLSSQNSSKNTESYIRQSSNLSSKDKQNNKNLRLSNANMSLKKQSFSSSIKADLIKQVNQELHYEKTQHDLQGFSIFKLNRFKGFIREQSKFKPLSSEISKCRKFGMRWKNSYQLCVNSTFDNLYSSNKDKTTHFHSSMLNTRFNVSSKHKNTIKNINVNNNLNLLFNKRILWVPSQFFQLIRTANFSSKKSLSDSFASFKNYINIRPIDAVLFFSKPPLFLQINRQGHLKPFTSFIDFPSLLTSFNSYKGSNLEHVEENSPNFLRNNGSLKKNEYDCTSIKNNKNNNNVFNSSTFKHYKESSINQSFGLNQKWIYCLKESNLSLSQKQNSIFNKIHNKSKSITPLKDQTTKENLLNKINEVNFVSEFSKLFCSQEKTKQKFFYEKNFSKGALTGFRPVFSLNNHFNSFYFHFITFCTLAFFKEKKQKQTWLTSLKTDDLFIISSTNKLLKTSPVFQTKTDFKRLDTIKNNINKHEISDSIKQNTLDSQKVNISTSYRFSNIISNSIKNQIKKLNCFTYKEQLSLYLLSLNFKPSFYSISPRLRNKINISLQKSKQNLYKINEVNFVNNKTKENLRREENSKEFSNVKSKDTHTLQSNSTNDKNSMTLMTHLNLKKGWVYLTTNSLNMAAYHKTIIYPGQINDLQLNASRPLYLECHSITDVFNFEKQFGRPHGVTSRGKNQTFFPEDKTTKENLLNKINEVNFVSQFSKLFSPLSFSTFNHSDLFSNSSFYQNNTTENNKHITSFLLEASRFKNKKCIKNFKSRFILPTDLSDIQSHQQNKHSIQNFFSAALTGERAEGENSSTKSQKIEVFNNPSNNGVFNSNNGTVNSNSNNGTLNSNSNNGGLNSNSNNGFLSSNNGTFSSKTSKNDVFNNKEKNKVFFPVGKNQAFFPKDKTTELFSPPKENSLHFSDFYSEKQKKIFFDRKNFLSQNKNSNLDFIQQKRQMLLSYLNQLQLLEDKCFYQNDKNNDKNNHKNNDKNNNLVLLIQPIEEYMKMNSKELKTYVHESTLKDDSAYKICKLSRNTHKKRYKTTLIYPYFSSLLKKKLFQSHQYNRQKVASQSIAKFPTSDIKIYPMSIDKNFAIETSLGNENNNTPYYRGLNVQKRPINLSPFYISYSRPMGMDSIFKDQNVSLSYQPLSNFESRGFPLLSSQFVSFLNFYLTQTKFLKFRKKIHPKIRKQTWKLQKSPRFSEEKRGESNESALYNLHQLGDLSVFNSSQPSAPARGGTRRLRLVEDDSYFKQSLSTFKAGSGTNMDGITQTLQADFIPRLVESPCFCFQNIYKFRNPILTFENLQRDFFGVSKLYPKHFKAIGRKNKSFSNSKLLSKQLSPSDNKSSTLFSYSQRNEMFLGVRPLAKTNIYSPFNGEVVLLNVTKGCMVLTSSNLISYYLAPKSQYSNIFNNATGPSINSNQSSYKEQNKNDIVKTSHFDYLNKNQPSYPINDILVRFLNMTDVKLDFDLACKLHGGNFPSPMNPPISSQSNNSILPSEDYEQFKNNYQNQVGKNQAFFPKDKTTELFSPRVISNIESKLLKVSNLTGGKPHDLNIKIRLGDFCVYGDPVTNTTAIQASGQLIHYNNQKITLRRSQPIFISPKGILHKFDNDFIDAKTPVITLSYQKLKTGDIIQGIPKVEQFFEARTTKRGRFFRDSLPYLLKSLFKRYSSKLPLDLAVRQSFYKIQQILVDGVHRVYKAQGVTISDKHLEVIVKQMTSKVRIIDGAQTGFFAGEVLDLFFVEKINTFLMKKITYEPLVLGITKASLEVDSFLSAASFQQTTRVLSKAALFRKKDFLKGLKENVILGNLIPAGTGFLVYIDL